jgi:cytochrome c oxidase assembly protein subunit 15
MVHRIGALLVLLVIGAISVALSRQVYDERLKQLGWLLGGLLALQVGLGINNVIGGLPLPNAVAHNGSAALLLLTLVTALHRVTPKQHRY